jgi:acetyltransferase-like isoleucine patch superfamily enzyme
VVRRWVGVKNKFGRILRIFAWLLPVYQARSSLVRHSGVKVGKGVYIGNLVYFDGEHPEYIQIEDEVAIAPGAVIIAHSGGSPFQARLGVFHEAPQKVVLRKGSWVGVGAIILPGVEVGEGAIVAAGSVVSQNVPPYTVVAGNPARPVRKLDQPGARPVTSA